MARRALCVALLLLALLPGGALCWRRVQEAPGANESWQPTQEECNKLIGLWEPKLEARLEKKAGPPPPPAAGPGAGALQRQQAAPRPSLCPLPAVGADPPRLCPTHA